MEKALACPVTLITVHDKQPRIVAGFVALLMLIFLFTNYIWINLFLFVDFFLRAFGFGKFSLLGLISGQIVKRFHIKGKGVDIAPKQFAAKLGFFMTLFISLSYWLLGDIITTGFAIILLFFALLESVFGICVGCKIYQFLLQIGWIHP